MNRRLEVAGERRGGGAAGSLGRLKLTAMRDRLDSLLDDTARREMILPETLALLCEAEVAHREERRIQMGLGIAKFPFVRTLESFDFAAQPSLDPKQIRDLLACRWVANGDTLLIQGPPGVGKTQLSGIRNEKAYYRALGASALIGWKSLISFTADRALGR